MRASIAQFAPVVCASLALMVSSGGLPDSVARAASECLAKPGAPPPQGKHWYYQTDRINQRRCWYLASEGRKALPNASRIASPERPAATAKAQAPQRTIGDIIKELNVETSATVGEAPLDERSSARVSDQPVPSGASEREPAVTRDVATDESARAGPAESSMPAVWPNLTTAEVASTVPLSGSVEQPSAAAAQSPAAIEQAAAATEPPPASSGITWYVLALLFGAFASAAFAYHRAAARRIARRLDLERKLAAGSEMLTRTTTPSTFAAEVGHWAEIARRQPMPSDDRFTEAEDAVRSLLRASRATHHEHAA